LFFLSKTQQFYVIIGILLWQHVSVFLQTILLLKLLCLCDHVFQKKEIVLEYQCEHMI